jgi:hypothetical protein
VQLALKLIQNKESSININLLCDPSNNCTECESEENYFENQKTIQAQWHQLKVAEARCKQWRLLLMKKEAKLINSAEERCHSNIPECFHEPLMKVAYKPLSRDKATFEELTPSEQELWNSFETDQIYLLLTGELTPFQNLGLTGSLYPAQIALSLSTQLNHLLLPQHHLHQ